jgi:cytochrome c-type biogenesis protein CcmE
MRPKHRNRRISTLLIGAIAVLAGTFLLLQALNDNKQLFKHPSDLTNPAFVNGPQEIRIGGLVALDSVVKGPGLQTKFRIIDFEGADPNRTRSSMKRTISHFYIFNVCSGASKT